MQDTIIEPGTETPKRFQCRHIFTDGHRCGSACLHHEEFCYYHHTTRRPVANPKQRRSRRATFNLPLPEDRSAIQASIGEVLQRIASNEIDPRRAGLLLYGLQIASLNLPKPQREATPAPETVEEITTDPELGTLAPRAEVGSPQKRRSIVADMIMSILEKEKTATQPGETNILPTLNAEATSLATPHKGLACPPSPHPKAPGAPSFAHFAKGGMYTPHQPPSRRSCLCRGRSGSHPRRGSAFASTPFPAQNKTGAPSFTHFSNRGPRQLGWWGRKGGMYTAGTAKSPSNSANPQTHPQKLSSSNQPQAANRKIHPPLLSLLHRWPPRPNQPAPPP